MITNKFLLVIVLVCSMASCKKVIDVKPEYVLDGQELNSIQDFEFALTGAYAAFQNTNYYGATDGASNAFVTLPDMLSDNLNETTESLGGEQVFSRWAFAEDESQIEDTWKAAYAIIC